MTAWTVSDSREIVSRHATHEDARRSLVRSGALPDGRLLTVHDPVGRIAALYRDGQQVG